MKATLAGLWGAIRTGEGLKGQLLRGGAGSLAVKVVSILLNLLLAIVLARTLGVDGFGIYSFVLALITLMAIPAQMGLPDLVVRETSKAQAAGDWALMQGLWRWSSGVALAMSAALMAIGAAAAWLFAGSLPEGAAAVVYWGLVLVPLVALGNLRGAALRGLRRIVIGQLPEFILRPAFLVALVLGANLGLSARLLSASEAMLLHAVASLLAFAIGAWLLLRARPPELAATPGARTEARAWLASALPLGAIGGVQMITTNIGLVLLGVFAAPEDVGLFRVALQGATLVSFGLAIANTACAPYFARFAAQGEIGKLQRIASSSALAATAFSVPVVAGFVLWGAPLLGLLFGAEFAGAYWPLLILSLGQLANALTASVTTLLTMAGHERAVLMTMAVNATLCTTLAAVLIPPFGSIGAAIAAAVSMTCVNLALWWLVRRTLGIESSVLSLVVRVP